VSQSIMRGIADAESEVSPAEHELTADPQHSHRSGRDALLAAASIVVVVYASIQMEGGMATLGTRWHLSDAIVGAVILAAITSLPNAVAAIYLARRGRGAATLSEAMNSNTINAIAGFLIPATIIGVGVTSAASTTVGWWYLGLTVVCLAIAYALRGITRYAGVIIIAAYAVFVARL
jgi:cation:H+ antiporter